MGKEEEIKYAERSIHLKCQLILNEDVILIFIRNYNDNPEEMKLKKGTNLTLINDQQMFCATDRGCGNGPLVRIDETNNAEFDNRYVGRCVIIPARFLSLHPNVL